MSNLQLDGENAYINVSRGLVNGASRLQKVGYSSTVTTGFQTVWNEAVAYVFPSSASTMTVSSGSANDTAAGTGARTLTVTGLDGGYNQITETIILNGQTAVTTINSYLRINTLTVTTAGSGGLNAGVVYIGTGTVTAGKPATVYNSIGVGFNTSLSAFTTIPTGSTGYLMQIIASTDTAGTQIQVLTTTSTGVRYVARVFQIGVGAGTIQAYTLPRPLTPGTDIVGQAINAGSNVKVSCQFEILLVSPQ